MKSIDPAKCSTLSGNHRPAAAPGICRAARERGQAIIELALVLPILLLLTVGVIEFGRLAYFEIEVSDAARAGAQYGAQSLADALDGPNITQAARTDAPEIGGALVVNPSAPTCTCPGSGSVSTGCPAGGCSYPIVYLTVTTTYTLNTLFSYPGIPTSFNLTGTSTMPVQRQ